MTTPSLRIACVDNLSAAAYRLEKPNARVDYAPPTGVFRRVQHGLCDAALLPVACLDHVPGYRPFGPWGIACTGAVGSVCLFSRPPLWQLVARREPIAATGKSQTSRRLLSLLCLDRYGRTPNLSGHHQSNRARLLIGDDAVVEQKAAGSWPHTIDLSAWWHAETGLPFVFARWVAREDLGDGARTELSRWLEACYRASAEPGGSSRLHALAAGLLGKGDAPAGYYDRLRIALTDADQQGLDLFRARAKELDKCRRTA